MAQSNSMIPLYISSNDCNFVIDYFEMNVLLGNKNINNNDYEKGCQYLNLNICSSDSDNDNDNINQLTTKIIILMDN